MSYTSRLAWLRLPLVVAFCFTLLLAPLSALAAPSGPDPQGNWWDVTPEPENPSPNYDSILYSEIAPRLREIETQSNRVRVEVIGQSAGGRNLFLVIVAAPEAMGRLGNYKAIREAMLKDPEHAQEMIDQFGDFKVPIFINGSIHGNEYPGTDACMRLIETLAFEDSEEVQQILANEILLINVCQNPDGRVAGTRTNANGFDLNRDMITQSQPEVQATVRVINEWNPMVVLDLHGFHSPMLIEPCTPPHNPNYEYDLYIKWALAEAEAMETQLMADTEFTAVIPFRDMEQGWDDWPPIFTPMYAMYHGAYGHTLETPSRYEGGVDAHYAAVWGALKFAAENRVEMVHDQIEIFRRGFLDLPQVAVPDDILEQSGYEQYNELTTIDFPAAYVIPAQAPLQQDPHEAARLVDFLIRNGVQVEQSTEAVTVDGVTYPPGSYVVWMNQPKRGLANTILWAGWDISEDPGLTMYDISGWSHPLLWGVTRVEMDEATPVRTHGINKADAVQGSVEGGRPAAYAYLPDCNAAIQATNALLAAGTTVYRAPAPFADGGRDFGTGTFIFPGDTATANELANRYGLTVYALGGVPDGAVPLERQHLAVYADEGVVFELRNLGFDLTTLSRDQVRAGLDADEYDVLVVSGTSDPLGSNNAHALDGFFAGGGSLVGIGGAGAGLNSRVGLLDVDYARGSGRANGVIALTADPSDSVTAQYPTGTYGFVYGPTWFSRTGDGVAVSATVAEGAFFISGFWPDWTGSGAAGMPIIVHGDAGDAAVTLMGIDPTFRAHPALTFRILANAIYDVSD